MILLLTYTYAEAPNLQDVGFFEYSEGNADFWVTGNTNTSLQYYEDSETYTLDERVPLKGIL